MSLGPEKIILILVVTLIVFGPQRLPDIARQVGAAVRELRRMQDTVRGELEQVLHPDFTPPDPSSTTQATHISETAAIGDTDHAALPPGSFPTDASAGEHTNGNNTAAYSNDDVTDDGFAGPRSFS